MKVQMSADAVLPGAGTPIGAIPTMTPAAPDSSPD